MDCGRPWKDQCCSWPLRGIHGVDAWKGAHAGVAHCDIPAAHDCDLSEQAGAHLPITVHALSPSQSAACLFNAALVLSVRSQG